MQVADVLSILSSALVVPTQGLEGAWGAIGSTEIMQPERKHITQMDWQIGPTWSQTSALNPT